MTIKDHENYLKELKGLVWKEVKLIREISSVSRGLSQARSQQEKDMINSRINSIKTLLHRTIDDVSGAIESKYSSHPSKEDFYAIYREAERNT